MGLLTLRKNFVRKVVSFLIFDDVIANKELADISRTRANNTNVTNFGKTDATKALRTQIA